MRNYIEFIGCRFKLFRSSDHALVYTGYMGADTNDDIVEAVNRWRAFYAGQPIGDTEIITQNLFAKLDKDNVLLLLNDAQALPGPAGIQPTILQVWFDYAIFLPQTSQEYLALVRAMLTEKSPRKTWAHGH